MTATADTQVGTAIQEFTIRAKNVQAREGRTNELNIHDDAAAQKVGFKRGFVAGGQSLGWISQALVEFYGPAYFETGTFECTFAAPIFDDEDVTVKGQVRECTAENAGVRIVTDVWIEKPDGTKAVVGAASALVK